MAIGRKELGENISEIELEFVDGAGKWLPFDFKK